jgi:hypothetical protein
MIIDTTYDMKKMHIFTSKKSKYIISEKTIPKLEKIIKEEITPPKKDIPVFVIRFRFDLDNDIPLRIIATPYIITNKLNLIINSNNVGLTIEYSKSELNKFGFDKEHIKKIIKAIKEETASFTDLSDNITHILNIS